MYDCLSLSQVRVVANSYNGASIHDLDLVTKVSNGILSYQTGREGKGKGLGVCYLSDSRDDYQTCAKAIKPAGG